MVLTVVLRILPLSILVMEVVQTWGTAAQITATLHMVQQTYHLFLHTTLLLDLPI